MKLFNGSTTKLKALVVDVEGLPVSGAIVTARVKNLATDSDEYTLVMPSVEGHTDYNYAVEFIPELDTDLRPDQLAYVVQVTVEKAGVLRAKTFPAEVDY